MKFHGLTLSDDTAALNAEVIRAKPKNRENVFSDYPDMSSAERTFLFLLGLHTEIRAPDLHDKRPVPALSVDRKWRSDFQWCAEKIAVEINGGNYGQGRHVRAGEHGVDNDFEKCNQMIADGWKVVTLTSDMLRRDPVRYLSSLVELFIDYQKRRE